jgi:hypothetical protein
MESEITYGFGSLVGGFLTGLVLGPFGAIAGLVIYGLARNDEQKRFGNSILAGSMILVMIGVVFLAFFGLGMLTAYGSGGSVATP